MTKKAGIGKKRIHIERSEGNRLLKCQLTPAELLACGQELADAHSEHERVTEEAEGMKAEFKGKLQIEEGKIGRLSALIRAGYEHRQIKCETVKDFDFGQVIVTRLDTKETVESRPLSDEERQMDLLAQNKNTPAPAPEKMASPDMDPPSLPPGPTDEIQPSQVEAALLIIKSTKRASVSSLQRRMRVGYTTACQIMDALEAKGFVGPMVDGSWEILKTE